MMEFPKLSSPSLKELFIRELESMILSGKLPIGTKLPSERVLAADMQVSRAVVNSGLDDMEKKGFIEVRPRVGAFVADFRRRGTVDTLLSIMRYNGGILRKPEVKALLEIRLVLEKLAIELAVTKITDEEVARLAELCDRFGSAPNAAQAADAVFSFHHELCVISGNTLLPLIFYSFRPPVIGLWERYLTLHGIASLHASTQTILNQLASRDGAGAIATLSESINRTIAGGPSIYFE